MKGRGLTAFLLALIIFATLPSALAENPTPFDQKFDFNIDDIQIDHNKFKPYLTHGKIFVEYLGTEPIGSVNISIKITDPSGSSVILYGSLKDLEEGEIRFWPFDYKILYNGDYKFLATLSYPDPSTFEDHIFDTGLKVLSIQDNMLERPITTDVVEFDKMVTYTPNNFLDIRYDERLHVVFNLAELHPFGKIVVSNGPEFVQEFPIDTETIYLDSNSGYSDVKIHLLKGEFLFQRAFAQNGIQESVTFFVTDKYETLDMVNIDPVEEDHDYAYLILVAVAAAAVGLAWFIIKTIPARPYGNVSAVNKPPPVIYILTNPQGWNTIKQPTFIITTALAIAAIVIGIIFGT